ncbi:aldo/keto reductase [Oscillochloris sp. ZM17-4]|uniref:aldo/keto reductase n=1 Tax=Oscillochloris sp. ZM17-4 TaxID=2866714 RepID=UPI001C735251|nr:aldo/keto reductase [Oscillochloris sp. ZM17-4]MBX0327728.1 aldo/keto reductase [Oscillochloris sp. ZM17-4]
MEYVRLGSTGMKVSRICLGCMTYGTPAWREWVLNEEASRPFFKRAIEAGITFFDTADMYSLGVSEEVTGRALADLAKRDDLVIATKVYQPMSDRPNDRGLSRKHIMASIDGSLRRLGTDYVDLYQTHRWDNETPIEETMEALHDVVKAGKARYIGASSMWAWQFAKAQHVAERHGWTRFSTMQNHYNLVYREEEREMIPLCVDQGVGMIPWSPLARGFLTGNRPKGAAPTTVRGRSDTISHAMYNEGDYVVVERLGEIAAARGVSPAQVALAWLMSRPAVSAPIIGASKMYQLEEAIASLDVSLSAEEIASLEEPYTPHTVRGHA